MPYRHEGLYGAWRRLVQFDAKLHQHDPQKQKWLKQLPTTPENTISQCLSL